MIRVTLDTSVLVSALEFGGRPAHILDLNTDEAFDLCICETIIAELRRILADRFDWEAEDIETTLEPIVSRATVVKPTIAVKASRDPNDNHVLACALTANADVIVSGDYDLLDLAEFEGIPILTPKQFLNKHFPETD